MTFILSETSIVDAFKNDESISEKSKEICNGKQFFIVIL